MSIDPSRHVAKNDIILSLPNSNIVESQLGIPHSSVWFWSRAIARARAVYARFLLLLSDLVSLSRLEIPLSTEARTMISSKELADIIMPKISRSYISH